MNNDILKWLIDWISSKNGKDINLINKKINIFDADYVDSLGAFELMTEIEEKFNITFDSDDLGNDNMSTLEGITEIISSKAISLKK